MSNFGDPTFSYHLANGLIWIKLALILTTQPVLPYDPRDYAIAIQEIFQNLKDSNGDLLDQQGIPLSKNNYLYDNFLLRVYVHCL